MKDEHISARLEPMKTEIIEFDFAERSIVASCVLSPSSAIKTRKKVEIIAFNIVRLLAYIVYGYLWQPFLLNIIFI